jgi:hypothetical protein
LAVEYKEIYDELDDYNSSIDLCDYQVKKLLDFEPYKVVIEEVK